LIRTAINTRHLIEEFDAVLPKAYDARSSPEDAFSPIGSGEDRDNRRLRISSLAPVLPSPDIG
jgi:hypothetical protein